MSQASVSLWPPEFSDVGVMTPIGILRQQAAALGEQTQNIVIGRVKTRGNAQNFLHRFSLWCAPLGYEVDLLEVSHGIDLYPAEVVFIAGPPYKNTASDADQLKVQLREVFASETTKKIVGSLLAQSRQ
jgi:hypothetical protein